MKHGQMSDSRWDVDFSLALFNRSGKYFIGNDLIDQNRNLIADVYYWRLPQQSVPRGLTARLIGKMEAWEHQARLLYGKSLPFGPPAKRRCLHLDPLTVLHRRPTSEDIVICHDLGPITHRELFATRVSDNYDLAYRLINDAQPRLVFVSKSSEAAFGELYGAPHRSEVIYPPIAARSVHDKGEPCLGIHPPFFLTVGSIGRRKNQASAIRAFAVSGLADKGISYVICGSKEPGHEEVTELAHRTGGVVLLPYVSDANLRWLYATALGFVLPSRLEGFGMPVAEAMGHGLVPLISAGGVLEEVAGAGAITVDPDSIAEIAAAFITLANLDETSRQQRVSLLHEHAKQFSEAAFRTRWKDALSC